MDGLSLSDKPHDRDDLDEFISNDSPPVSKFTDIHRLIDENQIEKALQTTKNFLNTEQENVDGLILAGKLCMQLSRFDESLKFYQTALKHDPKNPQIAADLKLLQKCITKDYESRGRERNYSAVEFCSMDPYPGDDELMALEKEILINNHLRRIQPIVVPCLTSRNPHTTAATHAMLSQQKRVAGEHDDAVVEISKAIQIEPKNPSWRVLRAQLHFMEDEVAAAINDLIAIPKMIRDEEIWKMGGLIFRQLNLPVLAELWFKCAYKVNKKADDEAAILFQSVRVKRLYDPLIPKDCPIKVEFTSYGRAIVATSHISAGTVIFDDSPVVCSATMTSNKYNACGNCGRSLMMAEDYFGDKLGSLSDTHLALIAKHWPVKMTVPCSGCDCEIYCSDDCRVSAWDSYHSVLCPSQTAAAQQLYDLAKNEGWVHDDQTQEWVQAWSSIYSPMVLAKLWASIICSVKRFMEADGATVPTVLHWAKAKAPYRRFIAFGSAQFKPTLPLMAWMFNKIFTSCHDSIHYEITDEEFQGRFFQAVCNLQAYRAGIDPYKVFLSRLTEENDALSLLPHLTHKPKEATQSGMFPLHACLNHSCLNNVEVVDYDCGGTPGVGIRAHRDIVPGDELLTTYIDTTTPKKLRRAWLFRSFNFWCECKRCKFEGDDAETCVKCGAEAAPGKLFPACGKCRKAWYCGVECQRSAWKEGHKDVCNASHSKTCDAD